MKLKIALMLELWRWAVVEFQPIKKACSCKKLGFQLDKLQEALDKETSISSEIGEILDIMNQFRSGEKGRLPTKQEWDDLLNQLDELRKQQLENYKELERLSNGAIRYRKGKGLKIMAHS